MTLYHGSNMVVRKPEVRKTAYTKDFSWGFYCTKNYEQAARWARKNERNGVVNVYEYAESASLRIKYDIVEGPMADDTIWNYVNDFLSGDISREAFWALAKFRHPTHQISFHTAAALACLTFKEAKMI